MNQALLENKMAESFQLDNPSWSWFQCQQAAREAYATFKKLIGD